MLFPLQAIEFYNHFPNAKIWAFECNPNTLEICRENIRDYTDRITLVEGAVTDYDGDITFYPGRTKLLFLLTLMPCSTVNQKETVTTWEDGNPGASSIFKSNGTYTLEQYVQDEISVNCHRLDTVMQKQQIPGVDIIWMDLQGAELLALKSLGDHLANVRYIQTEVSHKEIYSKQVMFSELHTLLMENGFALKNELSMEGWQEDAIYEKEVKS
jgi:FkbM family methyltransferase